MLDVGCGWGSFVIHAAERHGVEAVGITLSENQAELARKRVADAGLSDKVEIRVQDYRELAGETSTPSPRSGWSSTSASRRSTSTPSSSPRCCGPADAFSTTASPAKHGNIEGGAFSERYVFPDGETTARLPGDPRAGAGGFIAQHVEEFGSDYAETLRHWIRNLDDNIERAEELAGPERLRVWRLYLRAARNGFEIDFTSVYQVLCRLGES